VKPDSGNLPPEIPERFRRVPYNGRRHPGRAGARGLSDGANCQHYAYQYLRYHGYEVPNLRSSDLWADSKHSTVAGRLRRFDVVLFNREPSAWGAHVGVYLGNSRVLHLCKAVGHPEVRTLAQFASDPAYKIRIGAKRFRKA
jgi:lipoprotein Spr